MVSNGADPSHNHILKKYGQELRSKKKSFSFHLLEALTWSFLLSVFFVRPYFPLV